MSKNYWFVTEVGHLVVYLRAEEIREVVETPNSWLVWLSAPKEIWPGHASTHFDALKTYPVPFQSVEWPSGTWDVYDAYTLRLYSYRRSNWEERSHDDLVPIGQIKLVDLPQLDLCATRGAYLVLVYELAKCLNGPHGRSVGDGNFKALFLALAREFSEY